MRPSECGRAVFIVAMIMRRRAGLGQGGNPKGNLKGKSKTFGRFGIAAPAIGP
jgi:hypothetical protein